MSNFMNKTAWSHASWSGQLGMSGVLLLIAVGYAGPLMFTLDPYSLSDHLLAPPLWVAYGGPLLGTDDLGRDLLSRLVYGARSSLSIGFFVVSISVLIGTFLGLLAAVYGRWVDVAIMRLTDVIMTLPNILLAIIVVAVLGSGLLNAMLAVTIVAVPRFVRIVRSVAALEMKKQYVQAAYSCGASKLKILWAEVLPNCWGPVVVQATLGFSDAILETSALGFLGLGGKAPTAEWGVMLADARSFIELNPSMMILPGSCILLSVLSFNLLGDALQDLLNPKLRRAP